MRQGATRLPAGPRWSARPPSTSAYSSWAWPIRLTRRESSSSGESWLCSRRCVGAEGEVQGHVAVAVAVAVADQVNVMAEVNGHDVMNDECRRYVEQRSDEPV